MVALNALSLYLRQEFANNLPPNLSVDRVKFPNAQFTPPNNGIWAEYRLDYTGRERVTVGVKEYVIQGTLSVGVNSPVDVHTVEHEEAIQHFRFIFDEKDIRINEGVIRFAPSFVVTNGILDSWYNSNVICNFDFIEFS